MFCDTEVTEIDPATPAEIRDWILTQGALRYFRSHPRNLCSPLETAAEIINWLIDITFDVCQKLNNEFAIMVNFNITVTLLLHEKQILLRCCRNVNVILAIILIVSHNYNFSIIIYHGHAAVLISIHKLPFYYMYTNTKCLNVRPYLTGMIYQESN